MSKIKTYIDSIDEFGFEPWEMKREEREMGEEEVKTICMLQKTISLISEVKHKDKNLSSSVV